MRYITLLLIIAVCVVACKKDKKTEDPFKNYPEATCGDTTDDGKFEIWSESVQRLECADCIFSDSVFSEYEYIYGINDQLYSKTQQNNIDFYFMPTIDLAINLHLIQKGSLKSHYYSVSTINSKEIIRINQYDMSIFNPGCARLYYYITPGGGKNVIDKGHYDIEITQ